LFFGGWQVPLLMADGFHFGSSVVALGGIVVTLLQVASFLVKSMIGYWIIMWVKYSMPRIRIDQMLAFNWKFLTPLSLGMLIITAIMDKLLAPTNFYVLGMFLSNVILAWITIEILRKVGHRQRKVEEAALQPVVEVVHH